MFPPTRKHLLTSLLAASMLGLDAMRPGMEQDPNEPEPAPPNRPQSPSAITPDIEANPLYQHLARKDAERHEHSTIGPAKVCQGCGQKLTGAELREVRQRQAQVAGRLANQRISPWEKAAYPTRQEAMRAHEMAMQRAGARGK